MLVALYRSEHGLPYRAASCQPVEIFLESEAFSSRKMSPLAYPPSTFPLGGSTLWPFLLALHRMELPYMANVFAMYPSIRKDEDLWRVPEHVSVNITTVPDHGDDECLPLVIRKGKCFVRMIWEMPDRREKQLFRVGPKPLDGSDDIGKIICSWTEYFDRELYVAKLVALDRVREAKAAAEPFLAIPEIPLRVTQ